MDQEFDSAVNCIVNKAKELSDDNLRLTSENQSLVSQLKEKNQKLSSLTEMYNALLGKLKILNNSNIELIRQRDELIRKNQVLEQEKKSLEAENQQISAKAESSTALLQSELEEAEKELERLHKNAFIEIYSNTNEDRDYLPIMYDARNFRKTSLKKWEENTGSDFRRESCRKGNEGEKQLMRQIFALMEKSLDTEYLSDMVVLQDVCFESLSGEKTYDAQIDFLIITRFAVFVFDAKYRTGKVNINSDTVKEIQSYRDYIFDIISRTSEISRKDIHTVLAYTNTEVLIHDGHSIRKDSGHKSFKESGTNVTFTENLVDWFPDVVFEKAHSNNGREINISETVSAIVNETKAKREKRKAEPEIDYERLMTCPNCGKGRIIVERQRGKEIYFLTCSIRCRWTSPRNTGSISEYYNSDLLGTAEELYRIQMIPEKYAEVISRDRKMAEFIKNQKNS